MTYKPPGRHLMVLGASRNLLFKVFERPTMAGLVTIIDHEECREKLVPKEIKSSGLVSVFCGDLSKAREHLNDLVRDGRHFPYILNTEFVYDSRRIFKNIGYYREAQLMMRDIENNQEQSLGNSANDNVLGFKHVWRNRKRAAASVPFFKKIKGRYRDVPSVVVGAGPSLSQQALDWLKSNQDSLLIVCADSVLKRLVYNGISPDICCSIERSKYLDLMWKDVSGVGTMLVASANTAPSVISKYPGDVEVMARSDGVSRWLPKEIMLHNTGPSVGNMAFHVADYCGAKKIFLLGMDMAYDKAGNLHCEDCSSQAVVDEMKKHGEFEEDDLGATATLSYDGDELKGSIFLDYFKNVLEFQIRKSKAKEVVNIMPAWHGSPIDGTTRATSPPDIEKKAKKPSLPVVTQKKRQKLVDEMPDLEQSMNDGLNKTVSMFVAYSRKLTQAKTLKNLFEAQRFYDNKIERSDSFAQLVFHLDHSTNSRHVAMSYRFCENWPPSRRMMPVYRLAKMSWANHIIFLCGTMKRIIREGAHHES